MSKKVLKKGFRKFFWSSLLVLGFGQNGFSAKAEVDQSLIEAFASGQRSAEVLILLKDQAQVSAAETIIDRLQRIQRVRELLIQTAQKSQAPIIEELIQKKLLFRSYHVVNAILVKSLDQATVMSLAQNEAVESIRLNKAVRLLNEPIRSEVGSNFQTRVDIPENITAISADKVWSQNIRGKGIVVAGQDSGYRWDHPALKKSYRGAGGFMITHDFNWHDAITTSMSPDSQSNPCGYNTSAPCDDHGHGTHTMGTMIGFDWDNQTNAIGVAPEAKWIGCRNMDMGVGKPSTYLDCFEYFLAPYPFGGNSVTDGDPRFAPHVINNSWGCPANEGCSGNEFVKLIDVMTAAGIAVVAAAGNDGPGCGTVNAAPGFYTGHLFTVAAIDHRSGKIASFSSRGPSVWDGGIGPNISAPGEAIRSSVPQGGLGDGLYDYKSGTSMATPHVVGVIALLWSAEPSLIGNVKATMEIIQKSATSKTSTQTCGKFSGGTVPNAVFGYGVINAEKAIQVAKQLLGK